MLNGFFVAGGKLFFGGSIEASGDPITEVFALAVAERLGVKIVLIHRAFDGYPHGILQADRLCFGVSAHQVLNNENSLGRDFPWR